MASGIAGGRAGIKELVEVDDEDNTANSGKVVQPTSASSYADAPTRSLPYIFISLPPAILFEL